MNGNQELLAERERLVNKQNSIVGRSTALIEAADAAGRALSSVERQTLESNTAAIGALQAQVDAVDIELDRPLPRKTAMDSGDNPDRPLGSASGQRATLSGDPGSIGTLGDRVARGFLAHADTFRHGGRCAFTVRAAAGDPILTTTVGTTANVPVTAPGTAVIGAQSVIPSRLASSASTFDYPRYASVTGSAAVQATEGSAKSALTPNFTMVSQSAITVAGYAKMSEQAVADQSELKSTVENVLRRSIGLALDGVLVDGSGALFTGYEALAGATTSLVYQGLADAVSEEASAMQIAGFDPGVVILNPATWLGVVTAKGTSNDHYLTGGYLKELPRAMRGLRVGLSSSVAAGKALLVDTGFVEYLILQGLNVQMNTAEDDFLKNLVTLRAEMRVVPLFRSVGALRLVTPKA